jgi:hypothetical protein
MNRICDALHSIIVSSEVHCGFDLRSCQIKDCKIRMCCFSAKHEALKRKSKDWLARNQKNVRVEWHVYPWILFTVREHYAIPTKSVGLV